MDANVYPQTVGMANSSGATRLPRPQTTGDLIKFYGTSNVSVPVGTGTWKLENMPINTRVTLIADGTAVITTQSGSAIITLVTGDVCELVAKTSSTWAVTGGIFGNGGTNAQSLYTNAVTTQMKIPISIQQWREVASGAVGNTAAGGGVLSSNTTPTLTPVNGATDPTQIITWASSNNDVLLASVPIPFDAQMALGSTMSFNCTIKSGGTTNAVGFTVNAFTPSGTDLGAGAATTTNQTTTYANKTVAFDLSGGDYSGTTVLTVMITPAAHTTDTLVMKDAWLACSRRILTS